MMQFCSGQPMQFLSGVDRDCIRIHAPAYSGLFQGLTRRRGVRLCAPDGPAFRDHPPLCLARGHEHDLNRAIVAPSVRHGRVLQSALQQFRFSIDQIDE